MLGKVCEWHQNYYRNWRCWKNNYQRRVLFTVSSDKWVKLKHNIFCTCLGTDEFLKKFAETFISYFRLYVTASNNTKAKCLATHSIQLYLLRPSKWIWRRPAPIATKKLRNFGPTVDIIIRRYCTNRSPKWMESIKISLTILMCVDPRLAIQLILTCKLPYWECRLGHFCRKLLLYRGSILCNVW